jgi:hypothetical protein
MLDHETVQVLAPLQGVARQLFAAVTEPDHARVAACAARFQALDPNQRDEALGRLLEMQSVPALKAHATEFGIIKLPFFIGLAPSRRVAESKEGAVFGSCATSLVRRRGTTELAIGTYAEEQVARDAVGLIEKCAAALLAVIERQWTRLKFLADLLQLLGSLVGRRRSALDALVQLGQKPTASAFLLSLLGAGFRRRRHYS